MGITIISCFALYFLFFSSVFKSNEIFILQLLGKEVTDIFKHSNTRLLIEP